MINLMHKHLQEKLWFNNKIKIIFLFKQINFYKKKIKIYKQI